MTLTRFKAALILTLLFFSIVAGLGSVNGRIFEGDVTFDLVEARWGTQEEQVEPGPGDQGVPLTLTVVISSVEDTRLKVTMVSGTITYDDAFTNSTGGKTQRAVAPGIYEVGDTFDLAYTVNIESSLALGSHWVNLKLEFYYIDYDLKVLPGESYELSVPLQVLGKPDITYIVQPASLLAGEATSLLLRVENRGSAAAHDLEVSFKGVGVSPFNSDTTWNVNMLKPGATRLLPLTLYAHPDFAESTVEGIVETTYRSAYANTWRTAQTVYLTVEARRNFFAARVEPASVEGGSISDANLLLTYTGSRSLKWVKVTLAATTSFIVGQSSWLIHDYVPGERRSIPFQLRAPSSATSAALNTQVEYADLMGVRVREAFEFGIPIHPASKASTRLSALELEAKAGLTQRVELVLVNMRERGIVDVRASADVTAPFSLIGARSWNIPFVPSGGEAALALNLFTPSSSLGATGTLTLTVTYLDELGEARTDIHQLGFAAIEAAQPVSPLRLTPVTSTLESGVLNMVTVVLHNNGSSPVRGVEAVVLSPEPAQVTGSDGRWSYEALRPGESRTLTIPLFLPGEVSAAFPLTFNISYVDELGIVQREARMLGFVVGKGFTSPLTLSSPGNEVLAGTPSNYTLAVFNTRDYSVEGLDVWVELPPSVTLFSGEGWWSLGALAPREERSISIPVLASQEAIKEKGVLRVTLAYVDAGIYRREVRSLDVVIRGVIELRFAEMSITPLPVAAGASFTASGLLFNAGNTRAEATSVRVQPSLHFSPGIPEREVLVGDVDAGSQAPFSLTGVASKGLEGTYPLKLAATYKDDLGMWRTVEAELSVTVSPTTPQGEEVPPAGRGGVLGLSPASLLIGLAIGVVIAALGIRFAARRRRG